MFGQTLEYMQERRISGRHVHNLTNGLHPRRRADIIGEPGRRLRDDVVVDLDLGISVVARRHAWQSHGCLRNRDPSEQGPQEPFRTIVQRHGARLGRLSPPSGGDCKRIATGYVIGLAGINTLRDGHAILNEFSHRQGKSDFGDRSRANGLRVGKSQGISGMPDKGEGRVVSRKSREFVGFEPTDLGVGRADEIVQFNVIERFD